MFIPHFCLPSSRSSGPVSIPCSAAGPRRCPGCWCATGRILTCAISPYRSRALQPLCLFPRSIPSQCLRADTLPAALPSPPACSGLLGPKLLQQLPEPSPDACREGDSSQPWASGPQLGPQCPPYPSQHPRAAVPTSPPVLSPVPSPSGQHDMLQPAARRGRCSHRGARAPGKSFLLPSAEISFSHCLPLLPHRHMNPSAHLPRALSSRASFCLWSPGFPAAAVLLGHSRLFCHPGAFLLHFLLQSHMGLCPKPRGLMATLATLHPRRRRAGVAGPWVPVGWCPRG